MRQFVPLDLPHVEIIRESQRGAIYALNQKRNRKEQEKSGPGIFPEAKEPGYQ